MVMRFAFHSRHAWATEAPRISASAWRSTSCRSGWLIPFHHVMPIASSSEPTGCREPPDCVFSVVIRQWPAVSEPERSTASECRV